MEKTPHLAIWNALAFMIAAGVAARLLTSDLEWRSESAAAWAQAVGSVVGIGIAVWVGSDASRSAKDARAQLEQHRLRRAEAVQWSALHAATMTDSVIAAAEFMLTDPEARASIVQFGFGDWNFEDVIVALDAVPMHEAESIDVMHGLARMKVVLRAAQTRMPLAIDILRKQGNLPPDILDDLRERSVHAKQLTAEIAAAVVSTPPGH
jgi:hypothetical protein